MFKKPYGNELEYIKGKKNTKEERRQRIYHLEKSQNALRKVKKASTEYSDSHPPRKKGWLWLLPEN